MLNVTKELTALARKLGYTGKAPDTVAKAINAITASVEEGGGEGGGGCNCKTMIVHVESNPETGEATITDATAGEIYEAMQNGYIVFIVGNELKISDGVYTIVSDFIKEALINNNEFIFSTNDDNFNASSPNEYPIKASGGSASPFNPSNPSIPDY